MKFTLDIHPLSVNRAYQGRRFSTPEKKDYDRLLALVLPRGSLPGPYYALRYRFHLKNFALTDAQNCLKILTDGIVRQGLIKDDRYIVREVVEKFPAKRDRIEVEIESVERPKENGLEAVDEILRLRGELLAARARDEGEAWELFMAGYDHGREFPE